LTSRLETATKSYDSMVIGVLTFPCIVSDATISNASLSIPVEADQITRDRPHQKDNVKLSMWAPSRKQRNQGRTLHDVEAFSPKLAKLLIWTTGAFATGSVGLALDFSTVVDIRTDMPCCTSRNIRGGP